MDGERQKPPKVTSLSNMAQRVFRDNRATSSTEKRGSRETQKGLWPPSKGMGESGKLRENRLAGLTGLRTKDLNERKKENAPYYVIKSQKKKKRKNLNH